MVEKGERMRMRMRIFHMSDDSTLHDGREGLFFVYTKLSCPAADDMVSDDDDDQCKGC